MRLMLVWDRAATFPMVMVATARTQRTMVQSTLMAGKARKKTRAKAAKAAALAATAKEGGAPGGPIEHGHAEEQKGAGERPQDEVFQGRLIGAQVFPEEARQDVDRDGHDLEAQEDHDQVGPRSHEHH